MSGDGIDHGILGRLAGSLEEQGQALKSIQNAQSVIQGKVASHSAMLDSAHARVKTLEHQINGNGTDGLKTEMRLVQDHQKRFSTELEKARKEIADAVTSGHQRLEAMMSSLKADLEKEIEDINSWRKELGDKKVASLESQQKETRERRWVLAMFTVTLLISIAGLVKDCDAFKTVKAESKTSKDSVSP